MCTPLFRAPNVSTFPSDTSLLRHIQKRMCFIDGVTWRISVLPCYLPGVSICSSVRPYQLPCPDSPRLSKERLPRAAEKTGIYAS